MLEAFQVCGGLLARLRVVRRVFFLPHGRDDVGAAAGEPAPAYSEAPLGWELVIS